MDGWQVAQNYFGFAVLAGGIGGYYYYTTKQSQPAATASRRRSTNDFKAKPDRRPSVQQRESAQPSAVNDKQEKQTEAGGSKKKKAAKKQQQQQQSKAPAPAPASEVVVHEDKPEKESDLSNAQFAQQMIQARQGSKLAAPKGKENRVKTVKQSSARDTPILSSGSSQTGAEADDDLSPAASPALNSGDVSDMLEPKSSGPTSIRLTAPINPQKERAPKQAKEQVVESKKARQNRKKVEERRIQREAEEKDRKALEERQRRSAREARGEPAKNGVPVARAPANNQWEQKNTSTAAVNTASNGPLLDTFDAESTGSSNGGLEVSSAATSTTDANPSQYGNEDAQVAQAMKESEDESGWTTVSVGKKQQKARDEPSGEVTPIEQPQPKPKVKAPLPAKPSTFAANSTKTTGFAALNPDDPSNWDA